MKGGGGSGTVVGKRGSSKKKFGVADYFAVLAIDSFLPPNHLENDENNDTTTHNDGDNNGLTDGGKTPRNDNLSSRQNNLPADETATAANEQTQTEENKNDNSKNNQEATDNNLHKERFEREIVELDLLLSSSSSTTLPPPNLDSEEWELSSGKSLDINILNNQANNINNGNRIQLAYRRRRRRRHYGNNSQQHDDDDGDDNNIPAIADISIQYTKIKRSTIPNSQSIFPTTTTTHPHQQFNNGTSHQQQDASIQSTATTATSAAQPSSSSPITKSQMAFAAAAQSAKTLSSLAKRSGIAAAGKGLANKVITSRGGNTVVVGGGGGEEDSGGADGNNHNTNSGGGGISIGGSGIGVSMGGFVGSMIMRKSPPQQHQPQQMHPEVQSQGGGGMEANSNQQQQQHVHGEDTDYQQQQPNHLYDTGKEGSFETDVDGSTNFTDVDGNVPLWRSSSGIIDDDSTASNNRRRRRREHFFPDSPEKDAMMGRETATDCNSDDVIDSNNGMIHKSLKEMLPLPDGFDEWVVPDFVRVLHLPTPELVQFKRQQQQQQSDHQPSSSSSHRLPILVDRTRMVPSPIGREKSSPSSIGMEAMYRSPSPSPHSINDESIANATAAVTATLNGSQVHLYAANNKSSSEPDPAYLPSVIPLKSIPNIITHNQNTSSNNDDDDGHVYIPILAVRRQRVGEDERFNEDAAVVDVKLSYFDSNGVVPEEDKTDFGDDDDDAFDDFGESTTMMHHQVHKNILKMTEWGTSLSYLNDVPDQPLNRGGLPQILLRRNIPNGFADLPFQARVLDRFPSKDYRGMPFPEEELPLFCYPGGSYLVRKKLKDLPLPKCFGFVVKNERGDSIYVSCLSFLEPLTMIRKGELDLYSKCRQGTSLPHRIYCQQKKERRNYDFDNCLLAFDDVVTYECKTICLVGRYPYWTEFRRFLSHLHLLSGSTCDIPLERHVSHLLLSVPVPKPGGQCVLVPLSTMNEPMALVLPPLKDLPLVDLSYQRLFSALDVPTVVTVVLGFLCLEKKVILISTRQSLVLDCCELLKSLVFPFELVAPYGPLLTEAFMSLLEFPGATFVGIHDDGKEEGLAELVRKCIPEDSVILDLDNGEISCDDRYETLKAAYQIIPAEPRSMLIKEIEALCADAGIVPGQEPLDYGVDSAIDVTCPRSPVESSNKDQQNRLPFDDRAVRDNFLRFFCSILGGYERFLVVPDADFLISGNDWFDSSKFIATATPDRVPFLSSFVNTQMFQSFIQRRTEASDVHCMLFDECVAEFHSSTIPYGRLGGDVAHVLGDDGKKHLVYNLLVDECATEPDVLVDDDDLPSPSRSGLHSNKSFDDTATQTTSRSYEESIASETDRDSIFAVNQSGDIVTIPSTAHLNPNAGYVYCLDGSPSFPTKLDRELFLPKEPNVLAADTSEVAPSSLIRSEREREDANRLFNMTVSKRGPRETKKRHRCLWQLAKYMGSQFLGAWLMCIPAQISQHNLPTDEKSKVLVRALGALRLLRSHRRIVADEAAYRALIVACGKCGTDRRVELMKLYGLMRNDGIFPDAVTLGQYTRAIAEGYSNRSADANVESEKLGTDVASSPTATTSDSNAFNLELLDTNLSLLEESGMRWKSRGGGGGGGGKTSSLAAPSSISQSKTFETVPTQRTSKSKRQWHPVYCSSSFFPTKSNDSTNSVKKDNNIRLVALWSRTTCCKSCSCIPLDEEIQSGWDVARPHDNVDALDWSVPCPRCNAQIVPLIGYKEMGTEDFTDKQENPEVLGYKSDLPPQLESKITDGNAPPTSDGVGGTDEQGQSSGFVPYLSPKKLRLLLEQLVVEFGEEILDRERLREVNPQALFNLWWYCARFSLPLPLAISPTNEDDTTITQQEISDACAFASWDKSIAMQGCRSAAKAIEATRTSPMAPEHREKLFDNPSTDSPLLAFFNLQGYCQADWDHADLSEVLVSLVKACDTTDLTQAVACICQKNEAKEGKEHPDGVAVHASTLGHNMTDTSFGSTTAVPYESFSMMNPATDEPSSIHKISPPSGLDCYRTLLYLARYQCTTAFHAFFPTTTRACKGYHFWCAQGTPRPIFDRAFREAADDYNHNRGNSSNTDDADGNDTKAISPAEIHGVSEVGVGFRCIFGHMI